MKKRVKLPSGHNHTRFMLVSVLKAETCKTVLELQSLGIIQLIFKDVILNLIPVSSFKFRIVVHCAFSYFYYSKCTLTETLKNISLFFFFAFPTLCMFLFQHKVSQCTQFWFKSSFIISASPNARVCVPQQWLLASSRIPCLRITAQTFEQLQMYHVSLSAKVQMSFFFGISVGFLCLYNLL